MIHKHHNHKRLKAITVIALLVLCAIVFVTYFLLSFAIDKSSVIKNHLLPIPHPTTVQLPREEIIDKWRPL